MKTNILFINSLAHSGIGDFGLSLFNEIQNIEGNTLDFLETRPTWKNFINNWRKIYLHKATILVNLGFTSYGKSVFRNFLNFLFLSLFKSILHKDVVILLHDSPELTTSVTSGYRFFKLKSWGGAVASSLISGIEVHVFSMTLFKALSNKFHFSSITLHPFPSKDISFNTKEVNADKSMIVYLGYIAPYKGIELLSSVKDLDKDLSFVVIGGFHPVIGKSKSGIKYATDLVNNLEKKGIQVTGYISEEEISRLLRTHKCVGILPYKTTSGSSYAATYFFERGIPVIASDLEEFRFFQEKGAGILPIRRSAEVFAAKLKEILETPELYDALSNKSEAYSKLFSISKFVSELLN